MKERGIHAVTGAFGYSGKYIARRLLARGAQAITLTNAQARANPFGDAVKAYPFNFGEPEKLKECLRGVRVLYNTYWVRFNHAQFSHAEAVRNTEALFRAAGEAGVERIVHISITNPSKDSPLEYFRCKAKLERVLRESGMSHAILRPAVLFGEEDILINNIAWCARRLPVIGVFGDGKYRLQPIFVDDLAELAVLVGESRENTLINAIGPETFQYRGLVEEICRIVGRKRLVVPVPPCFGYLAGKLIGRLVGDVLVTREEIAGLMTEMLYVDAPPAGRTKLTEWLREHAGSVGMRYASELARRKNR